MMSRTTLQDIAAKAGVSKATVSLALRHSPEISERTRKRVAHIAEQLGYRPDPTLAKIASARWRSQRPGDRAALAFVASLHPDHLDLVPSEALEHPSPYILETRTPPDWVIYLPGHEQFKGASRRAGELGYSIHYHLFKKGDSIKNLWNSLYHRGVQGVLFSPIFEREFIREFDWNRFACVSIADHYFLPPTDFVVPKLSSHIYLVFNQILKRGYSRPGIVLYKERIQHLNNHILRGVFLSLGESIGMLDRLPKPLYLEHGKLENIRAWIDSEQPDAIIGFTDYVHEVLVRSGYRIPEDFAFVSLSTSHSNTAISGILDCDAFMGSEAVDLLDHKLRHGDFGTQSSRVFTTIQTEWKEGASLPHHSPSSADTLSAMAASDEALHIFPEFR